MKTCMWESSFTRSVTAPAGVFQDDRHCPSRIPEGGCVSYPGRSVAACSTPCSRSAARAAVGRGATALRGVPRRPRRGACAAPPPVSTRGRPRSPTGCGPGARRPGEVPQRTCCGAVARRRTWCTLRGSHGLVAPRRSTWAPTTSARRRARGFDPAEILARAVARGCRCPVRRGCSTDARVRRRPACRVPRGASAHIRRPSCCAGARCCSSTTSPPPAPRSPRPRPRSASRGARTVVALTAARTPPPGAG